MIIARKLQRGGEVPITSPNHPNLVAMYTMDNISGATLFDETPNNNDGTISGAVAVAGHVGNALDFDGVNDYVSLPTPFDFIPSTADFCIAGWVAFDSPDNGLLEVLVGSAVTTAETGFYLAKDDRAVTSSNRKLVLQVYRSSAGNFVINIGADAVIPNDTNYHFVMVNSDGVTAKAYVDNSEVASVSVGTLASPGSTRNAYLGSAEWAALGRLNGKEDQFRFYDRALTAAERATLYNAGAGV